MNVLSGEGVYTSIFDIKFNTVDKFKLNVEIVHSMVSYCNLPLMLPTSKVYVCGTF